MDVLQSCERFKVLSCDWMNVVNPVREIRVQSEATMNTVDKSTVIREVFMDDGSPTSIGSCTESQVCQNEKGS